MYETIIFFDAESTGFDFKEKDQIIELAAIAIHYPGGDISEMDEFVRLFKYDSVPERIVELTGITDLHLSMGKEEIEVMADFMSLIQGKTLLVAHNANFDLNFLRSALKRHDDRWVCQLESCDFIDTLTVYKDRRPYPHRLENAIEEYGVIGENSHRAIDDVKALKEVYVAMANELNDLGEYINLFGFNPKYPVKDTIPGVVYLPQGLSCTGKKLYERR